MEHSYTFEDGVNAADLLLALICEIQPKKKAECFEFESAEALAPVFAQIWERSRYKRPLRCMEGFFSRVLKRTGLETNLIEFWGAHELLEQQQSAAPIGNFPGGFGIIQFASWTGQSDGDAWCLDIDDRSIRCLDGGTCSDNIMEVRAQSYGVFCSPWEFVAHLRCKAWERKWLKSF
jgi:hypothetical protein